jgi:hypothetical protein
VVFSLVNSARKRTNEARRERNLQVVVWKGVNVVNLKAARFRHGVCVEERHLPGRLAMYARQTEVFLT